MIHPLKPALVQINSTQLSLYEENFAYSHAAKALSSGLTGDKAAGVNGVKGAAEIVKAQYSAAVSSESSAVDNADNLFNKGFIDVVWFALLQPHAFVFVRAVIYTRLQLNAVVVVFICDLKLLYGSGNGRSDGIDNIFIAAAP